MSKNSKPSKKSRKEDIKKLKYLKNESIPKLKIIENPRNIFFLLDLLFEIWRPIKKFIIVERNMSERNL